uniref:Uncharacterized protein n=1 Tax=Skeletonema marinoi TaxID=267567 RepID=A0A7S2PUJ0_9STRA|mmetsp:Transcript_32278/g.54515  ORF Transcript_32278/g.54515 Transcript_32278/m.54515 type:complete len:260 (+) Transcript_32278:246-1025(+)
MKFRNFPVDSGYMIINWEHEVNDLMVSTFREGCLERYKAKIKPAKLTRIFNADADNIHASKRWQLTITQNMKEAKTELLKTLTKKICRFAKSFNEEYDIVKRLVLISEPLCEQQIVHKDAEDDDSEFYVAIFTLEDNTEFVIVDDEDGAKKTLTLTRKQLIILDSQKYHAGGRNNQDEYNCRLHFRMGRKGDKAHKKSNSVGLATLKCKDCKAITTSKGSLKYHRQYNCTFNNNRERNRARMCRKRKETRQKKKVGGEV